MYRSADKLNKFTGKKEESTVADCTNRGLRYLPLRSALGVVQISADPASSIVAWRLRPVLLCETFAQHLFYSISLGNLRYFYASLLSLT